MDHSTLATLGANVEAQFSDLRFLKPTDSFGRNNEYTVIDTLDYTKSISGNDHTTVKAIAFKDKAGNIYFHFNGTGDGNWEENAVNYGVEPNPSDLQKDCLNFTDSVLSKYPNGNVYVTGHSQGGNNAQFVTMRSQYGSRIETCVSLDGPGLSSKFVANTKNMYGEEYYETQRNKIYGYNGESDYVSCLGQEQIIPEDQVFSIATPPKEGDDTSFMERYHVADYLLNDSGSLNGRADETDFRQLIKAINNRVLELPPDQQARAAALTMKIAEGFLGDGAGGNLQTKMTSEELAEFKELLIPILVDVLADNQDKLAPVLEELGFDSNTTDLIVSFVEEFNELSPEARKKMLEIIAQGVVVDNNGQLGFDATLIFDDGSDTGTLLTAALPMLWETLVHNPDDLIGVIHEYHIDRLLIDWLANHPLATAAIVVLSPVLLKIAGKLTCAIYLIDTLCHVVDAIGDALDTVKDFVVNCLNAIKEWCKEVKQWWRETFEKGVAYARNNPYLKVDTGKLYEYAGRVDAVMNRIKSLDRDLNDLYWQVGFLDLLDVLDVLGANLMVGGTGKLKKVKNYLTNTADRFVLAENETTNIFSGG